MSYQPGDGAVCDYCETSGPAGKKLFKPWTSPMEPRGEERVHICEDCLRMMVTAAWHAEVPLPPVHPRAFRELCRVVSEKCAADTRLAIEMEAAFKGIDFTSGD